MSLTDFHTQFPGGIQWRLTPNGVEIQGSGVVRTAGNPATVTRIWNRFGDAINLAAAKYQIPCAMLIATIAVESNGNPSAIRTEPGYVSDTATPNKVSPGLMQTLISTAKGVLPGEPIDRAWLLEPANSILAGAAVIASQKKATKLDPPLAAVAYNAGGVYQQTGPNNRWKMRQFPIGTGQYCDRYVPFLNDAIFMLTTATLKPAVGFEVMIGGTNIASSVSVRMPAPAGGPVPPMQAAAGAPSMPEDEGI